MITTAHFVIGGAVGVATGNPYAGFVAGVVSHFVADAIPHFDVPPSALDEEGRLKDYTPEIWIQVIVDGLIGLAVVAFFWNRLDSLWLASPFLWGAFGGFFPDLIDNVPFWNKKFRNISLGKAFHRFHESMHYWRFRIPMQRYWWFGIITQVVTAGLALVFLLTR